MRAKLRVRLPFPREFRFSCEIEIATGTSDLVRI